MMADCHFVRFDPELNEEYRGYYRSSVVSSINGMGQPAMMRHGVGVVFGIGTIYGISSSLRGRGKKGNLPRSR